MPLAFFGLGHWEIAVIGGVVFVLFGTWLVPRTVRTLMATVRELRKGANEVMEIEHEEDDE